MDRDGRSDLVICTECGPVKIFRNDRGRLAEIRSTGIENIHGLFGSISPGDVDNDGDLDFVIGNMGTNSSWVATDQQPVKLRYGNFGNEDSSNRIIASYRSGNKELPIRSFDALSPWVSLESDFESSETFARSDMDEIFGDKLDQSLTVSINELRSGVIINQTVGENIKFEFRPLPLICQSSPIRGCQLCDVNGDGFLDVYVLQNEDAVHPLDEKTTAGKSLLLLGQGDGNFKLHSRETGLFVPGIGKALCVVDLNQDARADFVTAEKNSKLRFFLNQSGHAPFAFDIKRISGGKQFIGTTVKIDFEDGSEQLHQIHCGAGYISQSPPIIYSGLNLNSEIKQITITWPDGTRKSGTVKSLFNK